MLVLTAWRSQKGNNFHQKAGNLPKALDQIVPAIISHFSLVFAEEEKLQIFFFFKPNAIGHRLLCRIDLYFLMMMF